MSVTELRPPAEEEWEAELVAALGREPKPLSALVDLLSPGDPGLSIGQVERSLRARGDVLHVEDGWVSLRALAEGAVLTHVVTSEELDLGVLAVDGDLDLWARLADTGLPLAGGGLVRAHWPLGPGPVPRGATTGLAGPPGWLDGYEPGQILALRLQAGSLLISALEPFPEPDEAGRQRCTAVCVQVMETASTALKEYLAEEPESGPSALLDDAIAETLYHHPGVLDEPVPPLSAVLAAAGLELRGGWVALPGLAEDDDLDDLDDVEIQALVAAHALLPRLRANEPLEADTSRFLLVALRLPVVAERLADRVELEPLPERTIDALLSTAGDDERAGALLLAARCAEGRGDWATAERFIAEAADLDPACLPAVLDAAQYAAARGDVMRADGLLNRAGVPAGDPTRRALRPLLTVPNGVVARNRLCPCDSGRKYKACCLRDVPHPLPARAQLAYARLVLHAQRPALFERVERFASVVDPDVLVLALDMALFEGGVIEDYLECRGHLLPADERQLLQRWSGTQLAIYEVVSVQAGRSVVLRGLPSGEVVTLRDRTLSTDVRLLDVIQARLLWDGEKLALLSMPLRVHRMRRRTLVDLISGGYDPDEVAAFWGPSGPPKLQNREGHELVFCEAQYDSPDEGAWERLREHLVHDDDRLLMVKELDFGELLIQGSVTRVGRRWTLEANSVERLRRLQLLFRDVVPDAVHVSESVRPSSELLQEDDAAVLPSSSEARDLAGLTPAEEARLLDEHMGRYEERWIDMQLPALDDRSPRAAVAAGGAALDEVEAMLDDMAWLRREQPGASGMSPDRLRALLGISHR